MSSETCERTKFEIARTDAGNPLFCPLIHVFEDRSDRPLLFDEAAQLLRLLLSMGLKLDQGSNYHRTIASMARVMGVALRQKVSHSDIAEYILYKIKGIPDPHDDARLRQKHHAMIGTFFGNLPADARQAALQWMPPQHSALRHIRIE